MESLAENYVVLHLLLLTLITKPEKEWVLLDIPETYADRVMSLCHSSQCAGCQVYRI